MEKIEITLKVTSNELRKILDILDNVNNSTEITTEVTKPGGRKSVKMPSFGRTKTDLQKYQDKQKERTERINTKEQEKQKKLTVKSEEDSYELEELKQSTEIAKSTDTEDIEVPWHD